MTRDVCEWIGNSAAIADPSGFEFILPADFDAASSLPRSLNRQLHAAEWLVNSLLRKVANGQKGPVPMQAQFLKRMMGDNYAWLIMALADAKVVNRVGAYEPGRRSFAYTLHERFANSPHVRKAVINKPMRKRLSALQTDRQEAQRRWRKPVHLELMRRQNALQIHGDEGRAVLAAESGSNPFDSQGVLIRDIEDMRFRLSVGNCGRVSNSITSIKKTVRPLLHIDGTRLAGVDLQCAQPALLGLLIQVVCGQAKTHNIVWYLADLPSLSPPSLVTFAPFFAAVHGGFLYETVQDLLEPKPDRDELKRRVMRDVFAKRGRYPSAVEDAFRSLFPAVHSLIRQINRQHHATLIRQLQRMESTLVIEQVSGRLMKRHQDLFLVTLHDAIYGRESEVHVIEAGFQETFDMIGYRIPLKTECQRINQNCRSMGAFAELPQQPEPWTE